ncbi:MAG: DUF2007 domain-containing protein [Deltaproteobacteria bacterium]|nr:DUF2007 domain-containing protein [Deltaproteobacteria bacterium]MBW1952528.1 DUF2007 domain-containing protein [Deltaproteobacteria bacterium]MBW2135147.1 DUF2007 domain-containing protein [Deltaproteobacteria bacterium]
MPYVRLRTLANRFEADLLTRALDQAGVDYFLRTFEDTAYDGLFTAREGWGAIWVAAADQQWAAGIIAQFEQAYGLDLGSD